MLSGDNSGAVLIYDINQKFIDNKENKFQELNPTHRVKYHKRAVNDIKYFKRDGFQKFGCVSDDSSFSFWD